MAAYIQSEGGKGGQNGLYYLATDLLGSITAIVPAGNGTIEYRSYDAWGRLRNPDDWTYNNVSAFSLIDRGYTFHEHLPEFGLINMNGRMYDPLVARFLSPDPYVQDPGSTQGFNRYSYCLNNPLKYIDPDGEIAWFIPIIVGAMVGAFTGGAIADMNGQNIWKGIAIGGLTGAVSGSMGIGFSALGSVIGVSGVLPGILYGAASGAIIGATSGAMTAALMKTDVLQGMKMGAITGAITGAISGGIQGGITAKSNGRHVLFGNRPYKDVSLELPFVMQAEGSWDCILANSESLEKYFGGERTMEDFREILNSLPEGATTSDYFKAAGFEVMGEPTRTIHIIRTMEVNKFPTTFTTFEGNINGEPLYHNATITRVRMWRPNSKATFWVNDPVRGMNYKYTQRALYGKRLWDIFIIGGIR